MAQSESPAYKWYVLSILTVVYVFNFVDRYILVALQEYIKEDLDLSDTQLGVLHGLAFAAFYSVLGIPIARYADKSNRRNIVAISLVIWSAMTVISGRAMNFIQLLLARIGVGVGEAGGSPPSHSIISDYFKPEKRATALAIYSSGIYFGVFLGYTLGNYLASLYGWRGAFAAIGIPGIIFALVVFFTVKEPVKGRYDAHKVQTEDFKIFEVVRILFKNKTFLFLCLASGFNAFITYGVGNFLLPFFNRVHEIDMGVISKTIGVTTGLGGVIGTIFGGWICDKLRARNIKWYLWIGIVGGFLNIIPSIIFIFTSNGQLSMWMTLFTGMFTAFYLGPAIAVSHSLVDAKLRSFASAILFFMITAIGLAFGPLTIGILSDLFEPSYGNESLRWAFLTTIIPGIISMTFFYLASKHYPSELAKVEAKS